MPTYRGLAETIEVRDDGWVEIAIQAVQSGNARKIFFIPNLDGDLTTINKRLGWLTLLRDSVARSLPVELEYRTDPEQGDLVEDVMVHPRPSLDGRVATRQIEGVVVWLGVAEVGAAVVAGAFKDQPDKAGVTILSDDGSLESVQLDLQRPEPDTAQSMLRILSEAHRTRRPVRLSIADQFGTNDGGKVRGGAAAAAVTRAAAIGSGAFVLSCEWLALSEEEISYTHAFIERIRDRHESYDGSTPYGASHVQVVFTTAPDQTPEGDVSENGTFVPVTQSAWLHVDSPLVERAEQALVHRLQVRLGLVGEDIHAVDLVAPLGSAARPVWIRMRRSARPAETGALCDNTPTIQGPDQGGLNQVPHRVAWCAEGYFGKGVWRFVVRSDTPFSLTVDGKHPCCGVGEPHDHAAPSGSPVLGTNLAGQRQGPSVLCHAFLEGLHTVELDVRDHTCADTFKLSVYRIR